LFFFFSFFTVNLTDNNVYERINEYFKNNKFNPIKYLTSKNEMIVLYEFNDAFYKYSWYSNFFVRKNLSDIYLSYVLIFKNNYPPKNMINLNVGKETSIVTLYNYNPIIVYEKDYKDTLNNYENEMIFVYIPEQKNMIFVYVQKNSEYIIDAEKRQILKEKYMVKNIFVSEASIVKELFYKIRKYSVGMKLRNDYIKELDDNIFKINIQDLTYYYLIYNEPHPYNKCHNQEQFIKKSEPNIMYIIVIDNKTNIIKDIIYKPHCCL
jgi:hypothetical protein